MGGATTRGGRWDGQRRQKRGEVVWSAARCNAQHFCFVRVTVDVGQKKCCHWDSNPGDLRQQLLRLPPLVHPAD